MAQAESRLMALPPELRNCIWAYVIGNGYKENGERIVLNIPRTSSWQPSYDVFPPPLTRVNHQIRSEALSLFYAANTFQISYSGYMNRYNYTDRATKWILCVGEHARSLSSLTLHGLLQLPLAAEKWPYISSTLRLTPDNIARPELLTVDHSRCPDSRSAKAAMVKLAAEKLRALQTMIRDRFEHRASRTLSCRDWVKVLKCVDAFFGPTYASYPVASEVE